MTAAVKKQNLNLNGFKAVASSVHTPPVEEMHAQLGEVLSIARKDALWSGPPIQQMNQGPQGYTSSHIAQMCAQMS